MGELTLPVHGGSDGAPIACDFSTNANPLGPNPFVLETLRRIDPWPYPDPSYRQLREVVAAHHQSDPDAVVPGAGGSELIHRIVRVLGGPVALREPCFGEYRHAATAAQVPMVPVRDDRAFIDALATAAVGFLASPNNPDGRVWSAAELTPISAEAGTPLVLDLAYAPLSQVPVPVPPCAWQLHAPNKAHGITGVRAAYLIADAETGRRLRTAAPSWVVGAHGVSALHAILTTRSTAWLADTRTTLWAWRDRLADRLRELHLPVLASPANFLLTEVGDASRITANLRRRGLKVRDCGSFELPGRLRLAARAPADQDRLLAALAREVVRCRH